LSAHGCQIAPRTYYAWARRAPSKRALWDMAVTELLAGYYEPDEHSRRPPESLYGSLKMWAHLQREGIQVARCTVERLMRANGWRGATRAKTVRTTIADPAATRAPDLVNRQFAAEAPNRLLVADFTYVRTLAGFCSFATDATVIDDGNSYTGHDEIHRWRETEASEYIYTVEVSHVEKLDDTQYVVTNHLEGDFPGGVVDIIYRFTLANDLITKLEIAP
jgi:hypothetical protein